jgi:hypothetical protein
MELAREERQQRLGRIEIDESAEPRKSDREAAGIGQHRVLRGLFVVWGPHRLGTRDFKRGTTAPPPPFGGAVLRPRPVDSTAVGAP